MSALAVTGMRNELAADARSITFTAHYIVEYVDEESYPWPEPLKLSGDMFLRVANVTPAQAR